LARYTYTESDSTSPIKDDTYFVFSESFTKSWIQGNSIISVKTGNMGWAQVIVRRATGATVWVMQLQNNLDVNAIMEP
jgi:hypothetical protein